MSGTNLKVPIILDTNLMKNHRIQNVEKISHVLPSVAFRSTLADL